MITWKICKRKGCNKTVTIDSLKKEHRKVYCGEFCRKMGKLARDRRYYRERVSA